MEVEISNGTQFELDYFNLPDEFENFTNYVVWHEGERVALVGMASLAHGPHSAWAYILWFRGKHGIGGVRKTLKFARAWMENSPYSRIETTIDLDNSRAHKIAEMLGMETEGIRRKAGPNGEDQVAWAWIR